MTQIAYYAPSIPQTVNVTAAIDAGAPSLHPIMTGDFKDMLVSCDLSRRVYGFVGGAVKWFRDYPTSWPRGVDVHRGIAFLANGTSIDLVCAYSGTLIRTISGLSLPASINSIRVSEWDNQVWVTLGLDVNSAGSVRVFTLTGSTVCGWTLTHHSTSSHNAGHPRDAVVVAGWVFVADTFGHRVYAYRLSNGNFEVSTDVFFPNSVHAITPAVIRICAEHENRVFDWKYWPLPVERTMVYSAPVSPFNDIIKTRADIVAAETGTFDPASTFTPKKSLCATEAAGLNTLYSPNSARMKGNDMIVSDTDNGRVLVINNGTIITEVVGFNNPVTSLLL